MDSDDEDYSYNEMVGDGGDDGDSRRQKHYKILKEDEIRQLQENDISEVSNLLSVSRSLACTLLRRRNWSPISVFEEWFSDEESVRLAIGLPTNQEPPKLNIKTRCKICFDRFKKRKNAISTYCGHPFCRRCWRSYLSNSIADGPGCQTLSCPEPGCQAIVGPDIFDRLASDEEKQKYNQFLFRSYIEGNRYLKWCPAPGCDLAVRINEGEGKNLEIKCDCSHGFCWNCLEENHRPVDCETVEKWMKLNTFEEENESMRWIMTFTKPCPKCKRNIEKKGGCDHMTCSRPCWFQFCWVCLAPLTGSVYHPVCNKYDTTDESNKTSLDANRNYLERYKHYYERWANNHKSRDKALSKLERWRTSKLVRKLKKKQNASDRDGRLVIEALEQVVECRRVLKWSYAYGYFLKNSAKSKKSAKEEFFEYLQGEAETYLERLHHCVEKEVKGYLKNRSDDFRGFMGKLVGLKNATSKYFQNLVVALESGLTEVTIRKKRKKRDEGGIRRRKSSMIAKRRRH